MNPKRFFLFLLCLLLTGSAQLSAQTIQDKIANKQQLTNLPTIYLTVPDAIGRSIDSVLTKTGTVAEYHAATIQVVDKTGKLEEFTDSKLEIKVRGNSTAQDSKRPYRLKFGKDKKDAVGNVIETHKHDMLGLGYKKRNWTLLTNHKDKSLLHNALTYYVGQAVGMPFCPGFMFVDLVINGEYRGNYQLSDHCEVGSHRIDVNEDTGWFIEAARGDMVEEPLVEAAGLRMSIKNPEPSTDDEVAALKAEVSKYFTELNHFWGIYSTPCSDEEFQNAQTGWRAYIDEESLANFYIGINLTDDYDGFMTVKMYREADGKLMFGPLWDKDLAYGNWQNHGKLCEEYQPGYTFCDHMARMMTDPYFVKKVHDKLHQVVDADFVSTMQAKIQEMGSNISESQALNQSKWWTCADYPAALKEFSDYIAEHTAFFVGAIDKKYKDMGCDNLPVQPGLGSGSADPETPGSGETTDEHICPYETTLGEWQNVPLPSSAIHPQATAAHLKVVGTSFFRLLTANDENQYIEQYSFAYNGANMSGREFDITDAETLAKAKAGSLYLRAGGGKATVTITCTVPEPSSPDLPCAEHAYEKGEYAKLSDGTYRRICDHCGTAEEGEGATTYYRFEVYTSAPTETSAVVMSADPEWPSSQNVTAQPNTLFVTEAAGLTGTNVVSAGTCSSLVITDGYPFYSPTKFKALEARYERHVKAETQWGTLCLPFKVIENDEVVLFALAEAAASDGSRPGQMTFRPATKTGKATPLVFRKKTANAEVIRFTAGRQDDGTITVDKSTGYDQNISKEVPAGWQFFGHIMEPLEVSVTEDAPQAFPNIYVISGDKFWHATGNVTLRPFRAFFGQVESGPASAQYRICVNGTDGIDYIEQEIRSEAPAYDIQGRKVRSATTGLYVVDGKKVFVR